MCIYFVVENMRILFWFCFYMPALQPSMSTSTRSISACVFESSVFQLLHCLDSRAISSGWYPNLKAMRTMRIVFFLLYLRSLVCLSRPRGNDNGISLLVFDSFPH